MFRDEFRLVESADADDPCLAVEMVRLHSADEDDTNTSGDTAEAIEACGTEAKVERIPLVGEIIPLNGHGYCASVTRCKAAVTGPNGKTTRITWSEQLGDVYDSLETCRIAIENAFEPDEFLG